MSVSADPESPRTLARYGWVMGGWAALGLAVVGIALKLVFIGRFKVLSTAVYMHRWLLEHERFGPVVRDWERHGVIRMRGKVLSTAVMVPLMGYMAFLSDAPPWTLALALPLSLFGLGFVWSRPSRPPMEDRESG